MSYNIEKSYNYPVDTETYIQHRRSYNKGNHNKHKDIDYQNDRFQNTGERKRYIPKEGDWVCPNANCKNINFSRRVYCNRCGEHKPESQEDKSKNYRQERFRSSGYFQHSIGKDKSDRDRHHGYRRYSHSDSKDKSNKDSQRHHSRSRDKYRNKAYDFEKRGYLGGPVGLFKEGDWKCDICQNVNFSWRKECNKCKQPRKDLMYSHMRGHEYNQRYKESYHNYRKNGQELRQNKYRDNKVMKYEKNRKYSRNNSHSRKHKSESSRKRSSSSSESSRSRHHFRYAKSSSEKSNSVNSKSHESSKSNSKSDVSRSRSGSGYSSKSDSNSTLNKDKQKDNKIIS